MFSKLPKRVSPYFLIEMLESRRLLSGGGIFADAGDIGSPALPGSLSYNNGTYTITAAGSDIGGNSDQFFYAHSPWTSDGTIIANVASLANTNGSAKAGVMFRNGTGATAAFAGVFVTPTSGLVFIARNTDGSTAGQSLLFGIAAPRFVKLTRVGGQITAFHSANGVSWSPFGSSQTISLGASASVGLAVTSRNVAATTTANFSNVCIVPSNAWNDNDVGGPSLPGSAAYEPSSNTFSVSGSGTGIGGNADQFNFANHPMTGGGSVIALVEDLTNTDPGAKAGVMIRDSTAAGAAFASLAATPQNDLVFQWRSTSGAVAGSTSLSNVSLPVWLRLDQRGNTFSAFYSTNNAVWTQVGTAQTVSMSSATVPAGIAVTSGTNSALATATFSGVSIVQGSWTATDIGSAALRGSATYDAPSNTYSLVGRGSGIAGTSDEFTFASRTLSGDGDVVTYVNSIDSGASAAKTGVMVRASSAPDAPFAAVLVSAQGGVSFVWRAQGGATAQQTTNGSLAAPISLRLMRAGNAFSAFYSSNGVNWLPLAATQTVPMPAASLAGIVIASGDTNTLGSTSLTGANAGKSLPPGAGIYSAADELFLHDLSQRSVRFFYDETNPNTGLVPDGSLANGGSNGSASSIASVGFGLTALTIGDRRGWLTHNEAYQRALTTVNFLWTTAAQVNGFYYHFLNPTTGQRSPGSELSSIDTALLMAGVLNVAQYWKGTAVETAAMNVFNRVNWPWMLMPNGQFFGHWTPESGFGGGYVDFSEAVLLYLLGLGSPTHPTAPSTWLSWPRTPVISYGGYTFVTATTRALFTVQYPQGWFDLRGLADSTGLNYYVNSQFATLAQRQMFINLQPTWPQYGANNWGATAADGPNGYTVWGGPPPTSNIDGSIVPTAPGGSLAFTPRYSVDALKHMQQTYGSTVYKKYGFVDAFNPHTGWTSAIVLGLDVGMMLLAAENSRSNFVWDVFKQLPVARQALATAFPSIKPMLLDAVSRKIGSQTFDLPVNLDETLSIENREGGPTQLRLTFGANIVKGPSFSIAASSGTVVGSTVSGSTLTINLSGVADAQTLALDISDVRHNSGSSGGEYSISLGVLLADANQDRSVNLGDFNIVAANFGAPVSSSADGDFNFDGLVNLGDFNLLASQFGKSLTASVGRSPRGGSALFGTAPIAFSARRMDMENEIDALLRRETDPLPR